MSRDLDARVATALGWTDIRDDYYRVPESIWYGKPPVMPSWESSVNMAKGITLLPHFSTELAAAWTLVMHLTATDGPHADQDWSFGLEYSSAIDWVADFTPRRSHPKAREYPAFQGGGITPATAIVAAFLKVMELIDAQ